jgi:hypothetical protein
MTLKPLVLRFLGPVLAVYLLHWGIWWLVLEADQIVMSGLTKSFNWAADFTAAAHIEVATWSASLLATEAGSEALLPIVLGLLIGWVVLNRRKRRRPADRYTKQSPRRSEG